MEERGGEEGGGGGEGGGDVEEREERGKGRKGTGAREIMAAEEGRKKWG